jgi:hypothetical protein
MRGKGIAQINGYEILAVVPSVFTQTNNGPDVWYLVGVDSRGDAVCATTYDLENHSGWSTGEYVMNQPGSRPGAAFLRAYQLAVHKAGADTLLN